MTQSKPSRGSHDHVARIVESYYDIRDAEMLIDGVGVSQIVEQFGTPLFVYDSSVISRKIHELRSILPPQFRLFYSMKANPNAAILGEFLRQGCGLEVASGGELFQALAAGCPADDLLFAGPGKSSAELQAACDAGIGEIHIESIDEARLLNEHRRSTVRVALRINPVDAQGGAMRMGGQASPFGIDEENLSAVVDEIKPMQNVQIVGIHLFMGTQILDAGVLETQYDRALQLARQVATQIGKPLQTIDFGGGFGTPYFSHESPLDTAALGEVLARAGAQMAADPWLKDATGIIEPGRFLVSEAGTYITKATRIKRSRGVVFVIVDGGMHHHLAASGNLGQTIRRNFPIAIVNKMGDPLDDTVNVVGPLCTPLDTIGRAVALPEVQAGDLVGIMQSGAYGRTASPHGFLSHPSPAEVMVCDGQVRLIRRRGEHQDLLADQATGDGEAMATVRRP